MKICFLAGADSVHSYKWVKYFADKGYQVHWISFTPNTQGELSGISFYQVNGHFPFNFFKFQKIIKTIKPDILHAHYAGVNGFFAALLRIHPFVLTAWGSDVLVAGKDVFKKFFVKYALSKADLITCDAKHMQEAMVKMGTSVSKIKIIYFGIDVLKFSPGEKSKEIEDRLKISGCPTVMSLRSLEPIYNIETLIKAVPLVLKDILDTKFIIAGKGSEEDKLKKLAEDLGVLRSISFIGWIKQNELPDYLRIADVYVSTSLSDGGIASSTAEAMACGVAPIITDFADNKEWVKDGENGFLMPLRDYSCLAEKISYLLKNKEEAKRFGRNARKVVEERDNYYKEMEKMEKLYESFKKN